VTDIAILCEICLGNGRWDDMWPGGDHDDEPVWGVAEVKPDEDSGEWDVTWHVTGLTVAQAQERLDGMEFPGPVHSMG
jgi:hypothetical protein